MKRLLARYALAVIEGLAGTRPPLGWEWSSTSHDATASTAGGANPPRPVRRGASPKRL